MERIVWPEMTYSSWRETCNTLHRWTQILGKIRLSKTTPMNHSWNSALYVTEAGLSTSVIHEGPVSFGLELDLVSHQLRIRRNDGKHLELDLQDESVAAFHSRCFSALNQLGIQASISEIPNELPDAIPLSEDHEHKSYDPEAANRFFQILLQCDRLMKEFRAYFVGKASPFHFFWGSFDLAVSRFSGRRAPMHPGGVPHLPDLVARDAYSHEVSSCGFWPGSDLYPRAAFYAYAYPQPPSFEFTAVPKGAFYESKLKEFILPYDLVRSSRDPDSLVLEFFQKCYVSAAFLGKWDRALLEESPYLHELQKRAR